MRSCMALTDCKHVLSDAPLQAGLPSMHANADYDLCPHAVNTVGSKPEMTKADRPVVCFTIADDVQVQPVCCAREGLRWSRPRQFLWLVLLQVQQI